MTERRYSEEEVAAIFERATDDEQGPGAAKDGMTLAQLQEIGSEVGIEPVRIARAALALEKTEVPITQRFLGLPVGVQHTIELDRTLSESEWEQLVVDLRQTFQARGVLRSDGTLRQWTNGNLQALLEPTATGQRVRLRTSKGNARAQLAATLMLLGSGSLFLALAPSGAGAGKAVAIVAAAAVGLFTLRAIGWPAWARRRKEQMAEIAARLTTRLWP